MKYSIKFIKEDALTQPAIVSGNTTQAEMDNQNDEQTQVDNQVAAVTPTLQAQDVEGLEDKDVMNYVYFNAPQDIDDNTRNALFSRADQIRQKQMNGSMTPKDQEVFAKGVISAATAKKNKAKLGESVKYIESREIINFIKGKGEPKGQCSWFIWDGNDFYKETDEPETKNGHRVYHLYNEWMGKVDRENKIVYIRPDDVYYGQRVVDIAESLGFKVKITDEKRELIDAGYDADDDEIFGEAYTSGRVDTFDEPSWEDAYFDDDDEMDDEMETLPADYDHTESLKELTLEPLIDAVYDAVDDMGNFENWKPVYQFVKDYLMGSHAKYEIDELERYAEPTPSNVKFFSRIIFKKMKNSGQKFY